MTDPRNLQSFPVPAVDDTAVYDVLFGLYGRQAVLVAFDLGLFAHLAKQPASVPEIAAHFGLGERSAEALLLACLSMGFLEREGDVFLPSEVSRAYLLPESQTYMGDYLHAVGIANSELTSYALVRQAILNERSQVYGGEALFESNAAKEERARTFTRMMHGHSIAPALAWPLRFDLSDVRHMVDVGGGSGAHAIGAALRWPALSVEIVDLATVAPVAEEFATQYGLSDRIAATACDFWSDPLPPGDLHFYGDILHDWPDEKCPGLLAKSFSALRPGGRIMIHEVLYDDDKSGPVAAALSSLAMLVWTEGKQRSGREYADMLEAAGFREVAIEGTFGFWSIVSARKPL